jgi:hypothetical protein
MTNFVVQILEARLIDWKIEANSMIFLSSLRKYEPDGNYDEPQTVL